MTRRLLKSPFGYVWYLGERVSAQYFPSFWVPIDPSDVMFHVNSPLDPAWIGGLYGGSTPYRSLIFRETDYTSFRPSKLAPPILSRNIQTQVAILEPRVRVVDLQVHVSYQDILMMPDPVPGMSFPPKFKGFDRAESKQVWRIMQSSMRRVEELSSVSASWQALPKTLSLGFMPVGSVAGSAPAGPSMIPPVVPPTLSTWNTSMEDAFRLFCPVGVPTTLAHVPGEPSRRVGEGSRSRGPLRR